MHSLARALPINPFLTRLFFIAAIACCLFSFAVPRAQAASLTEPQVQAILNLLVSFDVDEATISNVDAILHGKNTSITPPLTEERTSNSKPSTSYSTLGQFVAVTPTAVDAADGPLVLSKVRPFFGKPGTQVAVSGSGFSTTSNRVFIQSALALGDHTRYNSDQTLSSSDGTTLTYNIPSSLCSADSPGCSPNQRVKLIGSMYDLGVQNASGYEDSRLFAIPPAFFGAGNDGKCNDQGGVCIGSPIQIVGAFDSTNNYIKLTPAIPGPSYYLGPYALTNTEPDWWPRFDFIFPETASTCPPNTNASCDSTPQPIQEGTYIWSLISGPDPIDSNDVLVLSVHHLLPASLTASPTSGSVPLSVNFSNVGSYISFGDNTSQSSGGKDPIGQTTHTYRAVGNYIAKSGSDSVAITVMPVFAAMPTSGAAPLTVDFTGVRNSITFGDNISQIAGSGTMIGKTTHTYAAAGAYIASTGGSSVTITVTPCPPPQPTAACNGTWQTTQLGMDDINNSCSIGWMCVPPVGSGSGTSSSSSGSGTTQPSGGTQPASGSRVIQSFDAAGMMAAVIAAPFNILVDALTSIFLTLGVGR